jgi:murein DD-endopeptidase MepM/ murein hydrolase activator NlpD
MRLRLLLASVVTPLALWATLPMLSEAESTAQLETKIDETRGKINTRKSKERVLSGDISRYNRRIETLQERIDRIAARQSVVQRELDAKQAELTKLQTQLRDERSRLTRLKLRLADARGILAARLRELYQADRPDIVTVVLNAHGFADLVERAQFLGRIQDQDNRVLRTVRLAKRDATQTATRLKGLEARQSAVTVRVKSRRDELAELKRGNIGNRAVFAQAKTEKASVLSQVRSERKDLEGHLEGLEKEQAQIQAKLARQAGIPIPAGGYKGTGGPLSMPVAAVFTSPFGYRWGRLHAGIDLAAPEGTPIHAADSGRVVHLGWTGGYGNYTCIQHSASMSTCYAHQSRYGTSMGASVKRGQTIGYVGNTGHSFGAHLHFEVRINGVPHDPTGYL